MQVAIQHYFKRVIVSPSQESSSKKQQWHVKLVHGNTEVETVMVTVQSRNQKKKKQSSQHKSK